MKTILVPTDFSEAAAIALDLAHQIGSRTGAEIRLLHIIEHPKRVLLNASGQIDLDDPEENQFIRSLLEDAKTNLGRLVQEHSTITVKPALQIGDPQATLVENILAGVQDLIIIGTPAHRLDHDSEHLEQIIRTARCPVITIKSPVQLDNIVEIILATNLYEEEPEIIDAIKDLQKLLDARITVLKVLTANNLPPDAEQKDRMRRFVEHNRLINSGTAFINAPLEAEGVIKYAASRPGCLIALGTHGRKGLAHFFSGSVAEDLATQAHPPVWTCFIQSGR